MSLSKITTTVGLNSKRAPEGCGLGAAPEDAVMPTGLQAAQALGAACAPSGPWSRSTWESWATASPLFLSPQLALWTWGRLASCSGT